MDNPVTLCVDYSMLASLQSISHPRIPVSRFDDKSQEDPYTWHGIMAVRDKLREQGDWSQFSALLWRNKPDQRNICTTVLQNLDTVAAVLAVCAGIQVSTAVALAYNELIFAVRLHGPVITEGDDIDASFCGTFSLAGAGQLFRYALFAKPDARFYLPEHQQDELMLLHQSEEHGLFWGRDWYTESVINEMWEHSTDEPLDVWKGKLDGGMQND